MKKLSHAYRTYILLDCAHNCWFCIAHNYIVIKGYTPNYFYTLTFISFISLIAQHMVFSWKKMQVHMKRIFSSCWTNVLEMIIIMLVYSVVQISWILRDWYLFYPLEKLEHWNFQIFSLTCPVCVSLQISFCFIYLVYMFFLMDWSFHHWVISLFISYSPFPLLSVRARCSSLMLAICRYIFLHSLNFQSLFTPESQNWLLWKV